MAIGGRVMQRASQTTGQTLTSHEDMGIMEDDMKNDSNKLHRLSSGFVLTEWLVGPGLRGWGMILLACAALAGGIWSVGQVHRRAQTLLASRPITVQIVWPRVPRDEAIVPTSNTHSKAALTSQQADDKVTWIGPSLQEQIASGIAGVLNGRVLDAQALAEVGRYLTASGWFDGTPVIERTADDAITISGTWRRPACVVRSGGTDYVIDWQGRMLPIAYEEGTSGLPALLGVASQKPVDKAGRVDYQAVWPGEDVQVGLGLLGPLLSEPFASQVAGVDVHRYFDEGSLSILTDRGTEIVWGGPFGEYVPGEASSDEKMARLRRMQHNAQFGHRIDLGQARIEIFDERYFALDLSQ